MIVHVMVPEDGPDGHAGGAEPRLRAFGQNRDSAWASMWPSPWKD